MFRYVSERGKRVRGARAVGGRVDRGAEAGWVGTNWERERGGGAAVSFRFVLLRAPVTGRRFVSVSLVVTVSIWDHVSYDGDQISPCDPC